VRGLIGDRLLKRFVGDIRHQPEFSLPEVSGSESDKSEATTNPLDTIEDKGLARTPKPDGEATDASPSENGAKPPVDETLESHVPGRTA
jgi:hypothetical protein